MKESTGSKSEESKCHGTKRGSGNGYFSFPAGRQSGQQTQNYAIFAGLAFHYIF